MMERRLIIAVSLMIAVLVVPSFFLKKPPARRPVAAADSLRLADSARATAGVTADSQAPAPTVGPAPRQAPAAATVQSAIAYDSVVLADSTPGHPARYRFSTAGATIDRAVFPGFRSLDDRAQRETPAQLIREGDRLLVHRLVTGRDTVRLDSVPFTSAPIRGGVRLTGQASGLTETLDIAPVPGRPYMLDIRGEVQGLQGLGAMLVVGLGHGFANIEADSMDNYNNFAVAMRRGTSIEDINFRSIDPGVVRTVDGPLDWVSVKTKYFMGALLSADSLRPQWGGAVLTGTARNAKGVATGLETWVTMPIGPDGRFHYQLYLGPQTHQTLNSMGRDLDRASSYGWIFKPIVMPVAGWFTRLFIWMHEKLNLSYGMALVVFGVLVRLVLWPLNQKAMKSQVAMMAVQPVLKDLQARYKNDPTKLQQEMIKVYKEHNVNPLGGCLPLLLPMPVLLALFFVFSRAIELRGTPFLWLPDLALRDPLYITPVVMGLSMFALSKLSQHGMPPNPQAKMMTYMMPVMMTVVFLNFASGLNLYYAVSNIVSLPQQWLINKSRMAEMSRRQVGTNKG
jgi:YidC/Oxa1 family membrane protein insertase